MDKTFYVTDEQGNEIEMEILFTFQPDGSNINYVVYTNPNDTEGTAYASRYDEDGNLFELQSDEEWEMIEEVMSDFISG